jgi:WhiB family transcriptional regulator, redox-sensing transcriptional regulator
MLVIRTAGIPRHASHINPSVLVLARIIATAAKAWTGDALCAQADPDTFFAEGTHRTTLAKAICGRCPVRQSCLDFALETGEESGVWGGLDPHERQLILWRRKRQAARA